MIRRVEIGRAVNYGDLETALVKAAREMGWRAEIKHNYRTDYKLGSVEEVNKYQDSDIVLRGRFLKAMSVFVHSREELSSFLVGIGSIDGHASESRVKQYLNLVSGHLS